MHLTFCMRHVRGVALGIFVVACCGVAQASDWPRFRGNNGSGVSADQQPLPTKWSDTENLKWKVKLPGPGSSSPIVVGKRVYVTCWSGYAAGADGDGEQKDLRRHLVCLDRDTGNTIWDKTVEPYLPEDPYSGQFTQHGYASHTPVSDGERIYVFFGKTGALAFDLEGNKLWQTSVGTGSGANGWGTASSPTVYKDILIVPALCESKSLVGLNKKTGEKVWQFADVSLASDWGSPVLADCGGDRTDVVIAAAKKVWGLDPLTGKVRWQCDSVNGGSLCTSAFVNGDVVYVIEFGPMGGGALAVKAGGEGDVTKDILWRSAPQSRILTPLFNDNRIYWAGNKLADCLDAATGKPIYHVAITGGSAPGQPAGGMRGSAGAPGGSGARAGGAPAAGPGGPGGGRGGPGGGRSGRGGGGGMGSQDYSSPIMGDGKIYYVSRSGTAYVYAPGPEYKLLAQNQLASGGDFSATPAISDGQIFIRSSKFLYCVAEAKK